jgi:hypothetical protein
MRIRSQYDKKRAQDTLKEIDDFNDKLIADNDADLMHEMRAGLRDVACGKVSFAAPRGRRT